MNRWRTTTIDEACNVEYGTRVVQKRDGGSIYPVYGGGGATFFMDSTNRANRVVVSRFGMSEECTRYVDGEFFLNDSGLTLSTKDAGTLLPTFLDRLIISLNGEIFALGKGAAQKNLDVPAFRGLKITYPMSPSEQEGIVAMFDEAMECIATAKANAAKNLQNASDLLHGRISTVLTGQGEGWIEKPIADLCRVFADGDWIESKDQSSEGIRLIQTGNVGQNFYKDRAEKARYISEATFNRLRCTEIFEGDCLISRLPDPVGRCCVLPSTGMRMITAVDCTIVRFNQEQILPEFFAYFTQSRTYLTTVARACTGTTRNRISRSSLARVPIQVPPLEEQRQMVGELDWLGEQVERLTAIYEVKLDALEQLRKSLLRRTFSDQLPDQSL